MNNLVRSTVMVTLLALAIAGGVFVTLRAAEPTSGPPAAGQTASRRGNAPAVPAAPKPAIPAGSAQQPAASAKATPKAKPPGAAASDAPIEDEPTVAPDSQESADNSVTFPADI